MPWRVLESLILKEELLSGAKDKLLPAIHAGYTPVGEFHRSPPEESSVFDHRRFAKIVVQPSSAGQKSHC
jgi:hypothetical protein